MSKPRITDKQLFTLRESAADIGDDNVLQLVAMALTGNEVAREECRDWVEMNEEWAITA